MRCVAFTEFLALMMLAETFASNGIIDPTIVKLQLIGIRFAIFKATSGLLSIGAATVQTRKTLRRSSISSIE